MKCARCGKKLGFFEKKKKVFIRGEDGESDLKVKERVFCIPCFEQYIKELESRKSCFDCAYSELREDYLFGFDIPPSLYLYCKKIDMELKPSLVIYSEFNLSLINPMVIRDKEFYFQAERCVHFITEEEYREKALRGEIVKKKEAYFVICEYCGTRYDANRHPRCPNCGAISQ